MGDIRSKSRYDWQRLNPVLRKGEPGYDWNAGKIKIGDGRRRWNELPYITDLVGVSEQNLLLVHNKGTYSTLTTLSAGDSDFGSVEVTPDSDTPTTDGGSGGGSNPGGSTGGPTPTQPLLPPPVYPQISLAALAPYYTQASDDPYVVPTNDRPPSDKGELIGWLAAPSTHGYPDETNTGVPAGTTLVPCGQIVIWDDFVLIGGVRHNRPSSGSTVVGPVTIYPKTAAISHTDSKLPINTLIDSADCSGGVQNAGGGNALIRRSRIIGNSGAIGALNSVGQGGNGTLGYAAFVTVVDSRLHATTGEQCVKGRNYYLLRCNISGAADGLSTASNAHVDFCYLHGRLTVGTYHRDAAQILNSSPSSVLSPLFGGWAARMRKVTLLAYGETTGNAVLQIGDVQADINKVLFQDALVFGGNYSFNVNWNQYENGYGTNADGTLKFKQSSVTGQQETHPFIRDVFIERVRLGRKSGDGVAGGGTGGNQPVPRYSASADGAYITEFRKYANGGLYGELPPISCRDWVWDADNAPVSNLPFGVADWAARAIESGLDFTPYSAS
jgi:hypothetical protein